MEKECGHESLPPGDTMTPQHQHAGTRLFHRRRCTKLDRKRDFRAPFKGGPQGMPGDSEPGRLPVWAIAHSGAWIETEPGSRYRGGDFQRVPPPCHCWKLGETRYNPRRTSDSPATQIA